MLIWRQVFPTRTRLGRPSGKSLAHSDCVSKLPKMAFGFLRGRREWCPRVGAGCAVRRRDDWEPGGIHVGRLFCGLVLIVLGWDLFPADMSHTRAASDRRRPRGVPPGVDGHIAVFEVITVVSKPFKLDTVGHEPPAKHRHQAPGRGGTEHMQAIAGNGPHL